MRWYALDAYLSLGEASRERRAAEVRRGLALIHRIARIFPSAEPNAWMLQGRYDLARGRAASAASALSRSLRVARRRGSRIELARAHYWIGLLARSEGGRRHVPEGADLHFRASAALFEQLGFAWEAARSRAG